MAVGITAAVLLALLTLFALEILSGIGTEKKKLISPYSQIQLGMSRSQVVALMGSEGEQSETFCLGQRAGHEFEHAVAEQRIGAAYFLSWGSALDLVFTVAFDDQNRVISKARGGT